MEDHLTGDSRSGMHRQEMRFKQALTHGAQDEAPQCVEMATYVTISFFKHSNGLG